MLTSQKVIDAINEQIGYEFSASMQYYAIAAHFADISDMSKAKALEGAFHQTQKYVEQAAIRLGVKA